MKDKNKKLIAIIYESIFVLLAFVVVSFAWFTYSDKASTSGIDLDVKVVINISISNDGRTWGTSTTVTPTGDVQISELSGDGANLFYPVIVDKKVTGYTNANQFSSTDPSYIEFKFYILSNGPAQMSYGIGCEVTPANGSKLEDNIAGAVRVACFETTNGKTPANSVVWAPNSTYQYTSGTGSNKGTVNKTGTVESSYTYATSGSTTLKTIETKGNASGVSDDKNFVWGVITEQMVADMNPFLVIDTEYGVKSIHEITVRIWVEGTDREAVRDLMTGQFKVKLCFKAVDIDEE